MREIVETAMALSDKSKKANDLVIGPTDGISNSPLTSQPLAAGCVSLRALLGKPPYGTV